MKQKLTFFLAIVALAVCVLQIAENLYYAYSAIILIPVYTADNLPIAPDIIWRLVIYPIKTLLYIAGAVLLSIYLYYSTRKNQHERELETELKKQKRIQELQDELSKLKDGE